MSEVGGGDATSSMRGFRVELMEEGDVVLRGAFAAGKSVLSSSSAAVAVIQNLNLWLEGSLSQRLRSIKQMFALFFNWNKLYQFLCCGCDKY